MPKMDSICECGHYFEEHDWGAYKKNEASCCVVRCKCKNFNEAQSKKQEEY